jgi:hypothetical protein
VVQGVCEEDISLAYLVRPLRMRRTTSPSPSPSLPSSALQGVGCASAASTASAAAVTTIFPKVFELHFPLDVLTYLFYAIGREYPPTNNNIMGQERIEFNIDEHMQYAAASASDDENMEEANEKLKIKQVSLYCIVLYCIVSLFIA